MNWKSLQNRISILTRVADAGSRVSTLKLCVLGFIYLCAQAIFAQWTWQELPRRTCHECVIVKGYNPVRNRSSISLKMLPLADVPDGKMYLVLSRDGDGPAGRLSNLCSVGIAVIATTAFETTDVEVVMLADGKAISLGLAPLGSIETTKKGNKASGYNSRTDWETLSKLGIANNLELHFGGMQIKFNDEQKAAVRDFLAYAKGDN